MGKRHWVVIVNGQQHTVAAQWSEWSAAGEVLVDDRVVDAWGASLFSSPLKFTIAGKEAILRLPNLLLGKCELFVDGTKVRKS